MPTNLWQPGVSGNPAGRLRGSRNKLSEAVICALLRDFPKHGEKAIAKVRREQPGVYLRCLTLLIPREHKVQHSNPLKDLTDEQLEAMIEYIETSLAAQAGGQVKVIEGMIEPEDGSASGRVISTTWRLVFFEREDLPCGAMEILPRHRQSLQKSLNRSGAISAYRIVSCILFPRNCCGAACLHWRLKLQASGGAFWRRVPARAVRKNPAEVQCRKCNEFNACSSQKCRMP